MTEEISYMAMPGIFRDKINPSMIKIKVSQFYNIPDITLRSRKREVVQARQVAMYFIKESTKLSLASIAKEFGDYDHCSVLHAIKTVNNLCDTNKVFKAEIEYINKLLII